MLIILLYGKPHNLFIVKYFNIKGDTYHEKLLAVLFIAFSIVISGVYTESMAKKETSAKKTEVKEKKEKKQKQEK
ncbi:MAG: hypothetical protein Kow00102_11860 [Spirochaetota bacterium]